MGSAQRESTAAERKERDRELQRVINPDGMQSGMCKRQVFTDGEYTPVANKPNSKSKRSE